MRRTPLIDEIERLGLQHSFQLPARMPVFKPFEQAREFARSLGLRGLKEWYEFCKSGKKPNDIPSAPNAVYKNKGWVNWKDWLGTPLKSFKEAREFIRSLGLKSVGEWREYSKSGKKPNDIPSTPYRTYKDKGWVNWGDWLGTGSIATFNKIFRPFKQARKFARLLGLKRLREWQKYSKSGKRPSDIPVDPYKAYKDKGWVNWKNWLGTEKT